MDHSNDLPVCIAAGPFWLRQSAGTIHACGNKSYGNGTSHYAAN